MNLHTILVNVVLPVFLISTLVAALFAYWFALGATVGSVWRLVRAKERG